MTLRVLSWFVLGVIGLSACAKAEDLARGADTTAAPPTSPTATDTPTPTQPSTPPPDVAPRPTVGNCYLVAPRSYRRQVDGSDPVACAKRHTSETFGVFNVDPIPTSRQIEEVWRRCHDRFTAYVGASSTVSTLGIALIKATPDQVAAGQDWVRCDVIERTSFNGGIGRERSGNVRGALVDSVPAAFRGCSLRWPRVDTEVPFSSCARVHRAELIPTSTRIGGRDDPYPGEAFSRRTSRTFCADNVLNYVSEAVRYYYYYPTRSSWPAGSRDTVCWALDTSGAGLPPI